MTSLPSRLEDLDSQARDFRPDLLSIQRSPPAPWPRGVLLVLAFLLLALLLWAGLAKLDIVATAQGRLVPVGFIKVVQPAESGIVQDILVKDGDAVTTGQVLIRLDPSLSKTEISALSSDVNIKRLSLARVEAELQNRPLVIPKDTPNQFSAQVEAQFRARRESYQNAIAQETEALNKVKAEFISAQQVLSKLQQTVPIYKQSADAYQKLKNEGFIGEVAANEKRREFVERDQDAKAQEATVQSLRSSIATSQRKLDSITSSYKTQLENERIDLLTHLAKSGQDLSKSKIKGDLLEIRAPNDGIVKDLAITTKGAVVQAGALLMNVVPKNEPLQAEVLLSNEDVGFVSKGQPVQVKVAAFPFQKYGLIEGQVKLVSADSADARQQSQNGQPPLSYRAFVSVKRQTLLSASGEKLELSPGMLVTADIHQGKRTVIEYLLSPVLKVKQEAARER